MTEEQKARLSFLYALSVYMRKEVYQRIDWACSTFKGQQREFSEEEKGELYFHAQNYLLQISEEESK